MPNRSREKGNRREREIIKLHASIGICAERVPDSGAAHYRGTGHDIDVYVDGRSHPPLVAEVKGRGKASTQSGGFTTLERWLADYDILFFVRDRADPLVVLPWKTWARLQGNQPSETQEVAK